jgi:hypothetical protein
MPPLHLSSCLFATVVVHAYYRQVESYHHIFLALTISSVLFHTTHGETVRKVDKFLAHVSYIMVVMDTPKAVESDAQWLLVFPFLAACAWFGQSLLPDRKDILHFCLHLVGVLGMHVYLWVLYPNRLILLPRIND